MYAEHGLCLSQTNRLKRFGKVHATQEQFSPVQDLQTSQTNHRACLKVEFVEAISCFLKEAQQRRKNRRIHHVEHDRISARALGDGPCNGKCHSLRGNSYERDFAFIKNRGKAPSQVDWTF